MFLNVVYLVKINYEGSYVNKTVGFGFCVTGKYIVVNSNIN